MPAGERIVQFAWHYVQQVRTVTVEVLVPEWWTSDDARTLQPEVDRLVAAEIFCTAPPVRFVFIAGNTSLSI